MRKVWLLVLFVAATGCVGQDQQPEASPPSTTTTTWVGHPPPTYTTTTTSTTTTPAAPRPKYKDVWWALFGCETGGTYNVRAVSPNGLYRGAFQFDQQTWESVGMTGDPINYSYEDQLAAAKRLHAKRGWKPWPTCSKELRLDG